MSMMTKIAKQVNDQQSAMDANNIQARYVIIGREEAEACIKETYEYPLRADGYADTAKILGLEVVCDWDCPSCVKVVEPFTRRNWLRRV